MKKAILLLALLIIITSLAFAQDYYADIKIDLSENGSAQISGTTNYPLLQQQITQDITSKNGSKWTLDLNYPDIFSEAVYEIKLPQGAEITSISVPDGYRLANSGEKISIIGTLQNKALEAKIEYILETTPATVSTLPTIIGIIVIVLVAILVVYMALRKNKKSQKPDKAKTEKPSYNKEALTERQLVIVEHLEKKGAMTQAELKKITEYPKAALSRNLAALEKKEIIQKERKGMTMLVMLKKTK
jgi:uncharacterized membrane protein